jgi:hypothetical protein
MATYPDRYSKPQMRDHLFYFIYFILHFNSLAICLQIYKYTDGGLASIMKKYITLDKKKAIGNNTKY